jgi:hypothetical protein
MTHIDAHALERVTGGNLAPPDDPRGWNSLQESRERMRGRVPVQDPMGPQRPLGPPDLPMPGPGQGPAWGGMDSGSELG